MCAEGGEVAGLLVGFPNSDVGRDTILRFQMVLLIRAVNYGMLSYPNVHHHRILLYDLKFIIHYDHNIVHYKRNC